ncbi:lamin tail domain-containing protein [Amycolatopsis orientalis]|uniref:lamin tail domain-containing protein n=1 Tax=Amycolatopsis orientalis TaxID=31958 RepID=UPI0009DD35AD|nr:lamin tail domain-containing protein [Amycolatopsis orientalis]
MLRRLVSGVLGVIVFSAVTAPPSDSLELDPQVSTTVVINEVSPLGPNGELDEFLELRNISTVPVDLTGFALRFYTPTCTVIQNVTIPAATVLQPANSTGQYFVVTGQNFSGTISDQTNVMPIVGFVSLMPAGAGATALIGPTGRRVDAVAWAEPGRSTCLQEGQPARTPPPSWGLSMSRNYLSWDTDNNRCDFNPTPRTPGAQWPELSSTTRKP